MSRQLNPPSVIAHPDGRRPRCDQCLRPLPVCYCSQISHQQNNYWPITIVQDIRESRHAIGTARMAALSLANCELIPVDPDQADSCAALDSLRQLQPVLIYPGNGAADVSALRETAKRPLLFIDASWRRSRKMLLAYPWMAALPRFALTAVPPSRYRIRQQPGGASLSTLEAVVYTLQQLESEPARFNSLLATMDWVVDQQIKHMGKDTWQSNYQKQDRSRDE